MRLIGRDVLSKGLKKHADARKWIAGWMVTVEDASWQTLQDVRADYASADGVKRRSRLVVTVFSVRGNEYRLLTRIDYQGQVVLVLALLSHGEYDKDQWKEWW